MSVSRFIIVLLIGFSFCAPLIGMQNEGLNRAFNYKKAGITVACYCVDGIIGFFGMINGLIAAAALENSGLVGKIHPLIVLGMMGTGSYCGVKYLGTASFGNEEIEKPVIFNKKENKFKKHKLLQQSPRIRSVKNVPVELQLRNLE